ncbi:hypothetical protein O2N63_09435 [Aliiroseovarius sp. KMU-50]|uniref:CsbD family protein n=1 Tax=Aliiroseovarius salicola TaxID=3009082 RepID=A0ABT4W1G9_9RHOB|nr:hypothetical protein [Aliiroseovarius sp. KMU-50]MDA5094311.1 hypothetical protein [Aliiroseovarius sp. KMU-50]
MNMDRIISMVIRRVIGKVINRGVDAGIDYAAKRSGRSDAQGEMSPEDRKRAQQAKGMVRKARKGARAGRRLF